MIWGRDIEGGFRVLGLGSTILDSDMGYDKTCGPLFGLPKSRTIAFGGLSLFRQSTMPIAP